MHIPEFMGVLMFSIKSTQKQLNTTLNTCKPYGSVKISIALGECEYCCVLRKANELNKS